jgi:copper chaperone CopZ
MSYTSLGMVTTTIAAATIASVGLIAGCGESGGANGDATEPATTPSTMPENASGGIDVVGETVALNVTIKGMHCDGCVNTIASTVSGMEGVASCDVSLEDESAVITVADASMAPRIVETINELGYTATINES